MNWFRRWRINRLKERIAALEECLPILRSYCKGAHWSMDKDHLIEATSELSAAKVRLARLETLTK